MAVDSLEWIATCTQFLPVHNLYNLRDFLVLKVVIVVESEQSESKLLIYCKPEMSQMFQVLEG
jgi:hypothetical protein